MVSWKLQQRFNFITPSWTWAIPNHRQLASFHFNEIELERECELDFQFCDSVPNFKSMLTLVSLTDLDPIPEPAPILVPIDLEHEPPILKSYIPLMEKECENINYLIWKQLLNQNWLSNPKIIFFELVMVPEPITLEPKSTIPPSHILLLDIGIDHNNSEMILEDWSYKEDNFHDRIMHNLIQFGDNKNVNRKEIIKDGFCDALIRQVRRRHCDVYTQVRNTLTYIR